MKKIESFWLREIVVEYLVLKEKKVGHGFEMENGVEMR